MTYNPDIWDDKPQLHDASDGGRVQMRHTAKDTGSTILIMGWSNRRCAVGSCTKAPSRQVEWSAKVAGEAFLCEDHFREYRRRFPHLTIVKEGQKPDRRFSEAPQEPPAEEATQLEL